MSSSLFYRIINIVSLLFVIFSLILAFLLYGKRKELFENNEKMISAFTRITLILNSGSGAVPSGNLPLSSTKKNQIIASNLLKAEKQARDIIKQRNNMGKALASISSNLQLPVNFTAKQLQSVKTSQKSIDELAELTKQVNDRNDSLTGYFIKIAEAAKQPLGDGAAFISANKSLQGYSDTLNTLTETVQVNSDELQSAKKLFLSHDKKIKKLEKELISSSGSANPEFKSLIAEYEKQLEELQSENSKLSDSINQQNTSVQNVAEQIEEMLPDKKLAYERKLKEIKSGLYLKLTGKVLKYDKKWGFAIIDLGKFNKVDFTIDGKDKTATVALPLDKKMYVSRGNKFIAKVNVIKVVDKYAVVNLSSPPDGIIQPGDTVFFPVQTI